MAKKKKKTAPKEHRPSLMESLGIDHIIDIFQNERLFFFIGVLMFAVSVCMALSFFSFFTTGAADQSIIENLRSGDMLNEQHQFSNICGSIGARTSYFFMKEGFGVAAFAIPAFLFLWSLRLMKAYQAKLMKWFMCLMLVMIWSSIALARYLSFADIHFCLGGDCGARVGHWVEGFVGAPGLLALLAVLAIAFLMYLSSETVIFIRKLLNPVKFFTDRVKFTVTNDAPQTDDLPN
jgi:S-DNA-T family DNA segregation ATPase FtsK/SpoIIIE